MSLTSFTPVHRIGRYAAFTAPADIRRVVDSIWLHAADEIASADPAPGAVVVPDPGLSLCLSCRRGPTGEVGDDELLLMGPVRTPRRYTPAPGVRLEGIHLPPEWSRALLDVVPAEHVDAIEDYVSVRPDIGGPLHERLLGTRSAHESIEVFLDFARRRSRGWSPDGSAVLAHHALRRIRTTPAPARLRAVAGELGMSGRHLRRVIGQVTGLTPRAHARMARFLDVVRAADAFAHPDWVDLAAAHGFSDQAHLVREVRSISGLTPGRLHRARRAESTPAH